MSPDQERIVATALAVYLDKQAEGLGGEATAFRDEFAREHPDLSPELQEQIAALESTAVDGDEALVQDEALPASLSGYRIASEIGSGGMGRVLLAEDTALGRKLAIKTLKPAFRADARLRRRFLDEARALAQLNHPNIVRIYSLGKDEEEPHFVMEYIEGSPLDRAAAPLPFAQKADLVRKVAQAVEFLHERGRLHRDLKPPNILVTALLEPKLLDFGLARETGESRDRLTLDGELLGTPRYLSPEQARGDTDLDGRSDVFALGILLYEVLTGAPPFRESRLGDQIHAIAKRDPELPRRINSEIPSALQNICLKAMEKQPADRYQSARELADDLYRFTRGEPVLASPRSLERMASARIERHVADVDLWRREGLLSYSEHEALRKAYDRLFEREDAWLLELRRLSPGQVTLYLGAWILAIAAGLIALFRYEWLGGLRASALMAAVTAWVAWLGVRQWREGWRRIAIAYLLAACLLAPIALLVTWHAAGWFTGFTQDRKELELFSKLDFFRHSTNAQLWWALVAAFPGYFWLRRLTRSSVFALAMAADAAAIALATLLRMGLIDNMGRFCLDMLPAAALLLACAILLERRGLPADSRYLYPFAIAFTLIGLSGVAFLHDPSHDWLKRNFPWTRGQTEYLLIMNAVIYATLNEASLRLPLLELRRVAHALRFVIPGHVLGSLLSLELAAESHAEKRAFEVLLPAVAAAFVYLSIPRQRKNFLVTGLVFLAVGVIRLRQEWLKDQVVFPILLLALGLGLMFAARKKSRA